MRRIIRKRQVRWVNSRAGAEKLMRKYGRGARMTFCPSGKIAVVFVKREYSAQKITHSHVVYERMQSGWTGN